MNDEMAKIYDGDLLKSFSDTVQREREVIADVVIYLAEIGRRRLHAKEAYPSLFNYITGKYYYYSGAAYRRIQAAKLYQRFPEILDLLKEGKINLLTISLIEPHVYKDNGKPLIEQIIGKSKNEVEEILAHMNVKRENAKDVIRRLPTPVPRLEVVEGSSSKTVFQDREVSQAIPSAGSKPNEQIYVDRRIKIEFVADESLAKKIERAKEVLRHKFPAGKLEQIFQQALEDMLEKRDPLRKKVTAKESTTLQTQRRYIPQTVQRLVWQRDGGQCSYRSPDGRRCEERGGLEIDHVKPWSLGGESSVENLRLLCHGHNQWRAWKTFGEKK